MTKKNILPKQVAPVQRDTTATSSVGEQRGMVPQFCKKEEEGVWCPFAGDDAE